MKLVVFLTLAMCSLSENMLKLTNLYRRYYNMEELKILPHLQNASELQANTMCYRNKVTHVGLPGRKTLRERLKAFNFFGINIGENIAKQENNDYKEVFKVWIKSKLHRKNILGDYKYSGVSTCRGRDGNRYWVQVFGKRQNDITQEYDPNWVENNVLDSRKTGPDDKSKRSRSKRNVSSNPPISIENLISISRKLRNPKTITKTETITLLPGTKSIGAAYGPVQTRDAKNKNERMPNDKALIPEDATNEMEFLLREGEDMSHIVQKLPPNFQLAYKGSYKKYVAKEVDEKDLDTIDSQSIVKTPDTLINSTTTSAITTVAPPSMSVEGGPVDETVAKPSQPHSTKEPSYKTKEKVEEMFQSIIKRLSLLESTHKTIQSASSKIPTQSITIDLTDNSSSKAQKTSSNGQSPHSDRSSSILSLSKSSSSSSPDSRSSSVGSSVISSATAPVKTVTVDRDSSISTQTIYKTVFAYKTTANTTKTVPITPSASSSSKDGLSTTKSQPKSSSNILKSDSKDSSNFVPEYKTTKIGSISVIGDNNEVRTITVTMLKDNVNGKTATTKTKDLPTSTVAQPDKAPTSKINEGDLSRLVSNLLAQSGEGKEQKKGDETKDNQDLIGFNASMKGLFKDLLDKKTKKRFLFRNSNITKESENKLRDYIVSLINQDEEEEEKDCQVNCDPIDIGEPVAD